MPFIIYYLYQGSSKLNTIELEILKESRKNYDQQWSMKLLQSMRKNKLNLYLDIKALLLFFRVSFYLGGPFQEAVI